MIKLDEITNQIICGDCLEVLKTMPDNSVDSVVTDPPYGISFMGKKWDYDVPKVELWQECLRVLKPGGHCLCACGTRTQHRMAVNLEDAGFEIRDIVAWVYGSGFPKSHNIGKSVAKLEGVDIPTTKGFNVAGQGIGLNPNKELRSDHPNYVKPSYDNKYEGWGTNLKPAMELWTLARKPLSEKTVAKNTLKWGTAGINIDGCRVGTEELKKQKAKGSNGGEAYGDYNLDAEYIPNEQGRFPANFIHDGSEEVVEGFPDTKSTKSKWKGFSGEGSNEGWQRKSHTKEIEGGFNDSGSASRFFYCAKASKSERTCKGTVECNHPTIKPIKLMSYLCRLITPKGGTILDPFMGSGSTGIGAKLEGFNFIGIELDPEYCKIAEARIKEQNKIMNKGKEIIKQAIRKMKVAGQRKIDEGNRMIKQADDLENEII